MSSPQFQNASRVEASQFFRKPAAPSAKLMTPTRPVGPAQGGLPPDTYAVGVYTPAPRVSEAREVIGSCPAGFWIRAWAFLIDVLFLTVVQFLVAFVGLMLLGDGAKDIIKSFNTALWGSYFCFCHYKWGQTIGKMIFKIKVVTVEGLPLSIMTSAWRGFGEALSALTLGIGYLMAGVRSDKRALHDLVAKTRVVRL